MWYSAGTEWRAAGEKIDPWYDIRYASSRDGKVWTPQMIPVVGLEGTPWAGLTRPWVELVDGIPTLWFSARGSEGFRGPSSEAYRLYRVPLDGRTVRFDTVEPVIFNPVPTPDDWDGWMQVCPCIVPFRGTRIMFYNGNDFSRSGFGYAIEERQC